ncbi:hypothetical protein BGZ83_011913 [Gryganskiella cystojenkinii]|nr:hypothetical protein BGZ83_011913 [Gryganskiella cystojenkinii]
MLILAVPSSLTQVRHQLPLRVRSLDIDLENRPLIASHASCPPRHPSTPELELSRQAHLMSHFLLKPELLVADSVIFKVDPDGNIPVAVNLARPVVPTVGVELAVIPADGPLNEATLVVVGLEAFDAPGLVLCDDEGRACRGAEEGRYQDKEQKKSGLGYHSRYIA